MILLLIFIGPNKSIWTSKNFSFTTLRLCNAHWASFSDSENLYSRVFVLSTVMITESPSYSNRDERQGPALGVVPVFMPSNPFLSNLLVLFQVIERELPRTSMTSVEYVYVETTLLISGTWRAKYASLPRSFAVDLFPFSLKPCGLANMVFLSPSLSVILFISLINSLRGDKGSPFTGFSLFFLIRREPIPYAMHKAASFPLGSIKA
mmetsp:Transcript_11381/g.9786  ORF Transcript_11381/g.9786 Transcript_11381/m.9786 type:complete len:207 (-) Transcript_11381:392-1012(-)